MMHRVFCRQTARSLWSSILRTRRKSHRSQNSAFLTLMCEYYVTSQDESDSVLLSATTRCKARRSMTISAKDSRLILYGDTNLGMPLDLIDSLVVPNDLFFVRSNGPTPQIDPATWRLSVDGAVERVLNLSLDDLKALPYRSTTSFLECAGNSRSRLDPPAEGTEWQNDAAGAAVWGGTSLRNVLDAAGVKP